MKKPRNITQNGFPKHRVTSGPELKTSPRPLQGLNLWAMTQPCPCRGTLQQLHMKRPTKKIFWGMGEAVPPIWCLFPGSAHSPSQDAQLDRNICSCSEAVEDWTSLSEISHDCNVLLNIPNSSTLSGFLWANLKKKSGAQWTLETEMGTKEPFKPLSPVHTYSRDK